MVDASLEGEEGGDGEMANGTAGTNTTSAGWEIFEQLEGGRETGQMFDVDGDGDRTTSRSMDVIKKTSEKSTTIDTHTNWM